MQQFDVRTRSRSEMVEITEQVREAIRAERRSAGILRRLLPAHHRRDHDQRERRPGRRPRPAALVRPHRTARATGLSPRRGQQRQPHQGDNGRPERDAAGRGRRPGAGPLAGRLLLRVRRAPDADGASAGSWVIRRKPTRGGRWALPEIALDTPPAARHIARIRDDHCTHFGDAARRHGGPGEERHAPIPDLGVLALLAVLGGTAAAADPDDSCRPTRPRGRRLRPMERRPSGRRPSRRRCRRRSPPPRPGSGTRPPPSGPRRRRISSAAWPPATSSANWPYRPATSRWRQLADELEKKAGTVFKARTTVLPWPGAADSDLGRPTTPSGRASDEPIRLD